MIDSIDLTSKVLPVVALRKQEIHNEMKGAAITDEALIVLKRIYEEYTRFERYISNEAKKEHSELINELNKKEFN